MKLFKHIQNGEQYGQNGEHIQNGEQNEVFTGQKKGPILLPGQPLFNSNSTVRRGRKLNDFSKVKNFILK